MPQAAMPDGLHPRPSQVMARFARTQDPGPLMKRDAGRPLPWARPTSSRWRPAPRRGAETVRLQRDRGPRPPPLQQLLGGTG